jgi:aryl-alcohol dehydrogenase-like predicted oxidoreductase
MGCSSLGGGLYHGNTKEALATLRAAFDAGINFYDTADNYSQGRSERLIGRAFRGQRSEIVLATKGGAVFSALGSWALRLKPMLRPLSGALKAAKRRLHHMRDSQKGYDHSTAHLTRALGASLKRLQTDYVDLYQLYNPPTAAPREGDVFVTLEKLTRSGMTRFAGVSCIDAEDAILCARQTVVSSVQVTVNLLDREAIGRLLPTARELGVAVIARVPLAQGLLTNATEGTMAEQSARDDRTFELRKRRAERFRFLETSDRTLAQAALRFVLQLPGVSVTIPGMVNRRELEENLGALNVAPLSASELSQIHSM